MSDVLTREESAIQELAAVAIIDGQERPLEAQLRVAPGLRSDPPTDLIVIAGSSSSRGTQAGQLIGAVIENELRRSPGKLPRYLRRAVEAAHQRLQEKAARSAHLDWTASIACVLLQGQELIFVGVGQTAAFLLRDGQLELIEDATALDRPWLQSRLGAADEPQLNMCGGQLEPGDRVLIVVGHLPPHLSGARLRYQLESSSDAIIQELRSAVTPEDCLAALAFAWAIDESPAAAPAGAEEEDQRPVEPLQLPVGGRQAADEPAVYDAAVGGNHPVAPRRAAERSTRPRAQLASAAVGGPWRPAGVAGGRSRPPTEPTRPPKGAPRVTRRAPTGRPKPIHPPVSGLAQAGLRTVKNMLREFVPDNQAGLAAGFVQSTWRTGTAARRGVRPLGRGWLLGVGVGVLCLLVIGFLVLRLGVHREDPRQEFATTLAKAEAARAAAVAAPDREAARKQLTLADQEVKSALAIVPNDSQGLALQDQIQKDVKRLNGVVALPKVAPAADLTPLAGANANITDLVYQNGRGYALDSAAGKIYRLVLTAAPDGLKLEGNPSVLFQQDDQISDVKLGTPVSLLWATADNGRPTQNLLIMDAFRNLYQFNTVTDKVKVPVRGAGDWKSFKQAVSYQGNLYILDTEGDQVWRYYPAASGYDSEMKPMLESASLSDVTDFAVDGDIYLLTSTGQIRKYVGGAAVDFKMAGLDTPIGKGATLYTTRETKFVYVADRANGRVVAFDKNGTLKAQMVDERFRNVSTITADEKAKLLLFVAGSQIFTAPLPAEIASTG